MIRFKDCSICGLSQLPSQYVYRLHGETKYRAHCKRCIARRTHRWNRDPEVRRRSAEVRRSRRAADRAWLAEYRLERGCADCGYAGHAAALDFDHLPGHEKEFTIMLNGPGMSRERVLAEVAKCDVVCANCHRVRTWRRRREAIAA